MTLARYRLLACVKDGEHVHHVDEDKTNDSIENYSRMPACAHGRLHAIGAEKVRITCAWCGATAFKTARKLNHNAKQGKAGPFCGKRCVGIYTQYLKGGGKPFPVQSLIPVNNRNYGRVVEQQTQHI